MGSATSGGMSSNVNTSGVSGLNSIQYNHATINQNNPNAYNYYSSAEEKKEKVKSRLELLYKVKIPKQKQQYQLS